MRLDVILVEGNGLIRTVNPNWMGPRATMRTQRTTEMEPSRIIWAEEPMMLDCLDPIRYQLPVWRNGFFSSSDSSLKLMAVASVFFRVPLLSKIRNIYFRAVPVCWNASERERERERERRVIVIIKKTKEVIIEGTKTKVWGCWCVTSGKWKRTDNKNGNDGFDFRAYPHFSVLFLFLGATAVWEGCDHINDTGVHSFTLITVFQNGFSFYKYLLSRSSYIGILYNLVHFYNLFLLSFSFFFYQLLYMCVYIY